ncbi:MAG: hypothetical protein MZW92_40310 [Comamonadaceae bacterium]|nr:hypothetical protein [Comamonadaceae bacterium]
MAHDSRLSATVRLRAVRPGRRPAAARLRRQRAAEPDACAQRPRPRRWTRPTSRPTTSSPSSARTTGPGVLPPVHAQQRHAVERTGSTCTQDTYNTNGTVVVSSTSASACPWPGRQNFGAEAIFRLAKRNTLTRRPSSARAWTSTTAKAEHRREHACGPSWRVRPPPWAVAWRRAPAGDRTGTEHHNTVTHEGYYTAADNPDNNNPAVTFDNHPDTRRYDVIDRGRGSSSTSRLNLTPKDAVRAVGATCATVRTTSTQASVLTQAACRTPAWRSRTRCHPATSWGLLEDARTAHGAGLLLPAHPARHPHRVRELRRGNQPA